MSGCARDRKGEKEDKHLDKYGSGSPQLQFWYSQLEQGCDHVQFERTHPHPEDTDIMALKPGLQV